MIRSRRTGATGLVLLAVTALVCASAAAAIPTFSVGVHAQLAPAAGAPPAGQFDGVLVRSGIGTAQFANRTMPRHGSAWRLTWRLSIQHAGSPITATLLVRADKGAPSIRRVLCTQCTAEASGAVTLTGSQALRVAGAHAVVVVATRTVTLRGTLRASTPFPGVVSG